MNERIKELYLTAMREDSGEKWDTQEEFIERFAKLVVRECGIALNPMLRDMISRGQAYDLIKKHFGVE